MTYPNNHNSVVFSNSREVREAFESGSIEGMNPIEPVSISPGAADHRGVWLLTLLLVAACTVPNPNYRRRDAAPGDGASDPTAKELTSLVFLASNNPGLAADVTAIIDGSTVKTTVPFGRNHSLIATFITTGARVEVSGVPQESGVTSNVFLAPVVYHVVAGDGSTKDYTVTVATPVQRAYVKASNTDAGDIFGGRLAVSADGNTLAISASSEASFVQGVGERQDDNSASNSGAVYVFARSGTTWSQQAYIKASNTNAGDSFGFSLSLSADGNTLAVGAYGEASKATGNAIGRFDQDDNSAPGSGAVYVFTRSGTAWTQQAYIKASNTNAADHFGDSVTLSADGNTLAVGATGEDSGARGIGGNQGDNTAPGSGAVYVFARSGSAWSQQAYVKASNSYSGDSFGASLALSGDGTTLAIGAYGEANASGAVYLFARSGATWNQQTYVKASNANPGDAFGISVALSADGATLAVGAVLDDSAITGINGRQDDKSGDDNGAVYVFVRSGSTWNQQAYIKASTTNELDAFGSSVALSANGHTLAVGARGESSKATGIDGDQGDNSAGFGGAAYAFTRSGSVWSQQAYVKASNTNAGDFFGGNVALSADGITLAIGAYGEASAARGINDNNAQSDNSMQNSGAVYVFH